MTALLEVEDLGTWFYTRQGIVKAVDGVDFQVASGETLAIVGESGCGKSMTALSLMRLIPDPPGRIVSGAVKLGGRDLLKISEEEMRRVRGNEISMIFQDPMSALDPVLVTVALATLSRLAAALSVAPEAVESSGPSSDRGVPAPATPSSSTR